MAKRKPLVAIVGRPNVGKSTLFNRIVGKRLAVVSEVAGTTRDRLYADAEWQSRPFLLVDTGGMEVLEGWHTQPLSEDSEKFLPLMRQQALVAIQDADLIVQVVDGVEGLSSADREVAEILHRTRKPTFVAVNKLESVKLWNSAFEFYELGVGQVFPVSALHGTGTGDLLDAIVEALPLQTDDDEEQDNSIKVAILGRPNVGKSTLLNKLVGEERAIVSPIAGTTRDALDTELVWEGQKFTLIDTAGIRRRGKIEPGVEKYSVLRSLAALEQADVALLLVDAVDGLTVQDTHIAGIIAESRTSVIVLVNKWDAVEKDSHTINEYNAKLHEGLNFMPYVSILFISAQTGQRTQKILPELLAVYIARQQRITTSELMKIVREAITRHPPPAKAGQEVKIFFATQVATAPPTFVFFSNHPEFLHFSYERYLENRIREVFPFPGTPIRLLFRAREDNP